MLFKAQAFEHLFAARIDFEVDPDEMKSTSETRRIILLILYPPPLQSQTGVFIHVRRLFVGQECPYNYYIFEEYSLPP